MEEMLQMGSLDPPVNEGGKGRRARRGVQALIFCTLSTGAAIY